MYRSVARLLIVLGMMTNDVTAADHGASCSRFARHAVHEVVRTTLRWV